MRTFTKTTPEILDYGCNWAQWLAADTIATSSWLVDAGLTVVSQGNDSTGARLIVGGGTLGVRYLCINRITTAAGLTAERMFYIEIVQYKYT